MQILQVQLTSLLTHFTSSSPMRSCRILVRCSCRTTSSGNKSKPLGARSARSSVLDFRTCGKRNAVIGWYSCSCHKLKWMVLPRLFSKVAFVISSSNPRTSNLKIQLSCSNNFQHQAMDLHIQVIQASAVKGAYLNGNSPELRCTKR